MVVRKTKKLKRPKLCKLLCIFCYKPVKQTGDPGSKSINDGENETEGEGGNLSAQEKLQICDKFYNQLSQKPPPFSSVQDANKKKDERKGSEENGEEMASLWDPEKNSVCVDCFYAIDTHARLFEKAEKIQRRLRWQVDKLYNVMKCASKITSRVDEFRSNLKGEKDEESVVEFRQKVFVSCRQRLSGDAKKTGNDTISMNESSTALTRPRKSSATSSTEAELPLVFKCSKCSSAFPTVEGITAHVKEEHWNREEETGGEPHVVECGMKIVKRKAGRPKMKGVQGPSPVKERTDASDPDAGSMSLSDSDPDLRKNYPKLKRLSQDLLPHTPDSTTPSSSKKALPPAALKRKRPSSPKKSPKKRRLNATIPCKFCGRCFSAPLKSQAQAQLVQHLQETSLHDGKVTWNYVCKCGTLCVNQTELSKHVLKAHPKKKKNRRFCCIHCQKKFFAEDQLVAHFERAHKEHIVTREGVQDIGIIKREEGEEGGEVEKKCALRLEAVVVAHDQ